MMKYTKCNKCNGFNELLYQVNSVSYFYCADCDTETTISLEVAGAYEKLAERYGE